MGSTHRVENIPELLGCSFSGFLCFSGPVQIKARADYGSDSWPAMLFQAVQGELTALTGPVGAAKVAQNGQLHVNRARAYRCT